MHFFHPRNETERKQAVVELNKHFPDFHRSIHYAISKITGKNEAKEEEDAENTNQALYERLAAAPELRKYEIIGTDKPPTSFHDGYRDSHIKLIKVDPNFMEEFEKKKVEDEYNKKFFDRSGWQKSFMKALNSGSLKSVAIELPNLAGYKKKRRNAIVGRSGKEFNPRSSWHMAIYKVIHAIRAAKSSTVIDTVSDNSLLSQLHEFQSKADSLTLAKIKAALEMPSVYRTDEDLRFLNRILLSRLKSFAKFSPEQRIQFCRVMGIEKHQANSVIIKQGHPPWNFYFLFSGQCDVVKNRTDGKEGHVRVHVLNTGDAFGAVALEGLVQETRTATVISSVESVFLTVDKDEYRRIASGQDSADQLSMRISLLKNMSIFADCDQSLLEQVAPKTRLTLHEQDATIIEEGQISSRIYFIAKGSIRVCKKISVVKYTDRSKFIPHDTSIPLQKNQILSNHKVTYCKCQEGDHFPELDNPNLYDVEDDLNIKQKLINRLTFLEPRNLNISFVTVECKTPVVCIDMNSLDFAKIVTPQIIQRALCDSTKFRVSPEDLVQEFILKHEWGVYKKKIISDYRSKNMK